MKKLIPLNHSFIAMLFSMSILAFFLASFTFSSTIGDPWEIPAKYKKMKNPTTPDKEGLQIGKQLYRKHCASCHGKSGIGDGSKANELETECGDFTSDEYKSQADGIKYYKAIIGRDEMPNFEKKIRDVEDRWLVLNYIATLD